MNMWIVLCQAFTFAFLISQYNFFNEVEAEEPQTLSVGGWFGDLEKKLNVIKGVMHDVFQTIKLSAQNIPLRVSPPRRDSLAPNGPTTPDLNLEDVTNAKNNEDANNNNEEICPSTKVEGSLIVKPLSITDMENGEEYASGLSDEYSEFNNNLQTHSPRAHQKKKKKSKKTKKKIKPKRKIKRIIKGSHPEKNHVERKHVEKPHVPKPHVEKERPEQKEVRKMRPHKKKTTKFVKTTVDNNRVNESESDEGKKGKPVDIIVHIKMNE